MQGRVSKMLLEAAARNMTRQKMTTAAGTRLIEGLRRADEQQRGD